MGFAYVPEHIARDHSVSLQARAMWLILASFADKSGTCWPSQETIATHAGISKRQVIQLLQQLEAADLLYIHAARSGTTYTLLRMEI